MLRKLTAGMFAVALVFLVLGCSGDTKKDSKKDDGKKDSNGKKDSDGKKDDKTGGGDTDVLATDTIKAMNDLADVLEKVKDKASAEKAKPDVEKIAERAKALDEQGNKLPKAKQEELRTKHAAAIGTAAARMEAAKTKALKDPDAKKILEPILKDLK